VILDGLLPLVRIEGNPLDIVIGVIALSISLSGRPLYAGFGVTGRHIEEEERLRGWPLL
jgi:hypothetical protein